MLHFTNLENKNNILKYGILSVSKLKEQKIRYIANDNERFDNMLDFISVSITNINSFLFKRFKSRYQYQNKWVLCYLKPEILYEKKVLFYVH